MKERKVMTQSELNHEIARQTGESVADIARHGFTILAELPDDDGEPQAAISERYRICNVESLTHTGTTIFDDLKSTAGVRP